MSEENGNGIKKHPIPTISAETEILCRRLSQLQPGEFVSYSELSKAIVSDVQTKARHIMDSARGKAEREHGVVTVAVTGQGLRRAIGTDYCGIVTAANKTIGRRARRALRSSLRMPEAEYQELDNEDRIALNLNRTVCSTVAHFSGSSVRKKLSAAPEMANGRMAIGEVLERTGK